MLGRAFGILKGLWAVVEPAVLPPVAAAVGTVARAVVGAEVDVVAPADAPVGAAVVLDGRLGFQTRRRTA